MAESIDIKLEQLTQAIKGLYAKSSMSQGEIYNALTGLSQRYENLVNVSNEKIAATLVNEFRKTIDSKYSQTNQFLKELESNLKNLLLSNAAQSPKMAAEVTKLLSDTSNIYSKLNSQDLALQKIFGRVELIKTEDNSQEITKLSDNFLQFSHGFDNITSTLNKNFADFLEQIKKYNSKEDFSLIQNELNTISGNVNSVISAISIIDSKYRDLTSLIDTVSNRENIFNDALKEVKNLTNSIETLKESVQSQDTKTDIQALKNEINNKIETVKLEIQKIADLSLSRANLNDDNSIKEVKSDVKELSTNVLNVTDNVQILSDSLKSTNANVRDFSSNVTNNVQILSNNLKETNESVKNLSTTVGGMGSVLKNVHNLLNDEILYQAHKSEENYEKYLDSAKNEIKTLLIGLGAFKQDLHAINTGNIKILQEPIEKAMEEFKNQEIGKDIKSLSNNLRDVAFEIQSSIQNMQTSLNDMNASPSIKLLAEIADAIPEISDKLEIFRTHVVTENSANLGQIKTSFSKTIAEFSENLKNAIDKIQDDTKTINIETIDNVKVDLQLLSEQLMDGIETINEKLQVEFDNFKGSLNEFSNKNQQNFEALKGSLNEFSNNNKKELSNFSTKNQLEFDNFKGSLNEFSNKNQQNFEALKGSLNEFSDNNKKEFESFKTNLENLSVKQTENVDIITDRITDLENNFENFTQSTIKIDLQSVSDQVVYGVENVREKIQAQFEDYKTSLDEISAKQAENNDKISAKITDLESSFENFAHGSIKLDLQSVSDQVIDGVENIEEKIQAKFDSFKTNLDDFSAKQTENTDKISNKLASLEIGLENFNHDAIDKINDAISASSAAAQDTLNEIKGDILDSIIETDKANKNSLGQFEGKIDKLLDSYIGSDLDSIVDKKSLRETVADIETKIDRTNLQQIHNAKELLEEIQAGTSSVTMKLNALEENRSIQGLVNVVSKIAERLQGLEDFNADFSEEIVSIKEKIEQKLKENVQKITALIESPKDTADLDKQNSNIDSLSNKVQEYLSNFEYLKSNISQEIKENLASEFQKIDNAIKKIKSASENSNYTYTLEDIESDLAKVKLAIEKNSINSDELKTIFEKIIELRTVGLENVKINRDVEQELGHMSGWFKDAVNRIDDLSDRIDNLQNIGFEDIKTRIVQSERSKTNSSEFNAKLENALKILLKTTKTQDEKIDELNKKIEALAQAQSENFNPNQFIDIFYENMTQTKMLSNRVEIIEDKINTIQNCVEKLINYVEQ